MIRIRTDSSGKTLEAIVVDDKGISLISGDGWENRQNIKDFYSSLKEALEPLIFEETE